MKKAIWILIALLAFYATVTLLEMNTTENVISKSHESKYSSEYQVEYASEYSSEYDRQSNDYNNQPLYFYDNPCTQDCSGHEAGYEWAEEKGISSVEDCGGNSNSFIEGCESYVEEYSDSYEDDYYEEDDYSY